MLIIINEEYAPKVELNKKIGTFQVMYKGRKFGTLYVLEDILDYKSKYKKHRVIVKCMNCGKVFETEARRLAEGKRDCGNPECKEATKKQSHTELIANIKAIKRRNSWSEVAKKRAKISRFLTEQMNMRKLSAVYDYEKEEVEQYKEAINFLYELDMSKIFFNQCPHCKKEFVYDEKVSIRKHKGDARNKGKYLRFRIVHCPRCGYTTIKKLNSVQRVNQSKEVKEKLKKMWDIHRKEKGIPTGDKNE